MAHSKPPTAAEVAAKDRANLGPDSRHGASAEKVDIQYPPGYRSFPVSVDARDLSRGTANGQRGGLTPLPTGRLRSVKPGDDARAVNKG